MVAITKDEAMLLRKKFKNVCIVRLGKTHSQRHHYLAEETPNVLETIAEVRQCDVSDLTNNY